MSEVEIVNGQVPVFYKNMMEELKELMTEYRFLERYIVVEMWHKVGKTILQYYDPEDRSQNYGENIIDSIADMYNRSPSTIYSAIKCAKKYPELSNIPGGKDISWTQVVSSLPDTPKESKAKKKKKCPNCGVEL